MGVIGIRQLRQNASAYLRLVEAGETLQIADRGRPIALLVPIPKRRGLARLKAEARLSAAEGDLLALGPPLQASARVPLPSERLGAARDRER